MPRVHKTQTNFTSGELSPLLLGRGDLSAYENGAAKLRNTFIFPTGGIQRRAGLRFIDTAQDTGRFISFEFNTEQVYLLVFTDSRIDIYRDEQWVAEITSTPWTVARLPQINWTQSADTLLVVHPEHTPPDYTNVGYGVDNRYLELCVRFGGHAPTLLQICPRQYSAPAKRDNR